MAILIRANPAELGSIVKLDQKTSKKDNSPAALKNLALKNYVCICVAIIFPIFCLAPTLSRVLFHQSAAGSGQLHVCRVNVKQV